MVVRTEHSAVVVVAALVVRVVLLVVGSGSSIVSTNSDWFPQIQVIDYLL